MSVFSLAFREAEALFDETFGETYRLFPMARPDPNGRSQADASRFEFNFAAIPSEIHARAASENGPSQFDMGRPGHASARLQLSVFLDALPYRPAKGDVVRPVTVDPIDPTAFTVGADTFELTEIRPEGGGRAALDFNFKPKPGGR